MFYESEKVDKVNMQDACFRKYNYPFLDKWKETINMF